MKKIVFDIETVGEKFEEMDTVTQQVLTHWIKREAKDEKEYQKLLNDLKQGLGFSPLTGEIVAIGVLEHGTGQGAVYYQAPLSSQEKEWEKQGIKFKPMKEKEMLEKFWEVAEHAEEFISFNGRGFDVPFLMIRSAIHHIRPSKDLLSNRYLSSQKFGAKHIDLMDQLTFYGATWKRPNLHLACRAFDIRSPKAEGVTGDDVAKLFQEKKYAEIAYYNLRDLRSTAKLYDYWEKFLKF